MTFLNSANADSRIKLYSYDSFGPASEGSWAGKRGVVMRVTFLLTLLLAAAVAYGCSVQQPAVAPAVAQAPARPLPFKGRLAQGDASELPSAVAMSLSSTSSVTFSYREELTHDDYHVPLIVSAFDPVTYVGAPLGDLGVTAFASLSIVDGDKVLGDYTAKVHVSKSYSLYSEPTHKEVEQAARAAVREKIDQKLYRDADRLTQAVAGSGTLSTPAADK
jgi:hypothetical protein